MKAVFLACAVCGSFDAERITEERPHDDLVQAIVICRSCGFVYRNPCIPEGNDVSNPPARDPQSAAREIVRRVTLGPGEAWLDLGTGDGNFAAALGRDLSGVEAVLVESNIGLVEQAKRRNPQAAVLPSFFWEADLPESAFSLVTVRRADHLFADHRRDMERIRTLMKDGGVLYIERSRFVDGLAASTSGNSWFGREQFVEYLSLFFEVFDRVEYVDGGLGVFCRRLSPPVTSSAGGFPNRYVEHIALVKGTG